MNFDELKEQKQQYVDGHKFLDNFVLPDYQMQNISNIQSIVGKIFSSKKLSRRNFTNDWIGDFGGVEKVVLFILDGLGYDRLLHHIQKHRSTFAEIADKCVLRALSSSFPATTSTALTSIFTGMTPSEHGIIGYNMYVPEYGLIFNTLSMNLASGYIGRVNLAENFSKVATPWLPLLRNENCAVKTFTRRNLVRSGLSNVIHKHQEIVSYNLSTDLIVQLRKTLQQSQRLFACVYYPGVDTLAHGYGPYSEETEAELRSFETLLKDQLFNRLPEKTKRETKILITADHGAVPTVQTYFLDDPQISQNFLIPPTGDMRATYLFPKYQQEDELKKALTDRLERITILPSTELINSGAFGPLKESSWLKTVVGTLTAISQGKDIMIYPYHPGSRSEGVFGAHGGLTPEEMIVPLLSAKISEL